MTTTQNKELVLERQGFAGDTEFSEILTMLHEAHAFLKQDIAGISLDARAGTLCVAEANLAWERLQTLQSERPSLTCALVLGEFKAGKSTLINALVGKTVAAFDVFELTQVVCRIVPTPDTAFERVELVCRDRTKPSVRLDLDTFLERAAARDLADFSQATVYVKSPLDLVLVDTPGLGATRKHELDALGALGTADVALCVIDCESLGGGRDAATIARMQEIDLPFICILTKADVLGAGEADLVGEYITDSLGVPADRIFPVSAQQKIETGTEAGMERLRTFLHDKVSPNAADLRARSLLAQSHDLAAAYAQCLGYARADMRGVLDEVKEYAASLKETSEVVTNDLCISLSDMLRDRLRLQMEQMQAGRKGNLSEADLLQAINDCFAGEAEKGFVKEMQDQLDGRFQDEWVDGFKQHLQILQENLRAVQDEANEAATQEVRRIIETEKRKQEAVSEATGAAISGAAVAAGVLAMGFVPGVLFAVPFLVTAWYKRKKAQGYEAETEDAHTFQLRIDEWREDVIGKAMEQMRPKISSLNDQVAERAADNYAQKRTEWPLSLKEFTNLYNNAKSLEDTLTLQSRATNP